MEAKIEGMNKESLVAALSTCNEKVHELKAVYEAQVSPAAREMKDCRKKLEEYMVAHKMECIQVEEDVYARLLYRVGGGETLTPLLFMDVVNNLTAAAFLDTARKIEEERERRKQAWLEEQRTEIRKQLAKAKAKPAKKRASKRVKIEAMATAAQSLGTSAASNVDEIVAAASKPVIELEYENEEAHVEALVRKLPYPVPEVKYTGKDKAYAQRPPPPFGRALTAREMFVEVLYMLIKERHKPLKPVVSITSRPGKVANIASVAPKDVFDNIRRFVRLKTKVSLMQTENRSKRREYTSVMDLCKTRLQPMLASRKFEANMPTADGLRTISVEVVRAEKVTKRLNMWDLGCMLEKATEGAIYSGSFDTRSTSSILTERVMSHLIREMLKQMSTFTKEHTAVVERVRLRRGRVHGGDGSSDDDDDDDEEDDESNFDE